MWAALRNRSFILVLLKPEKCSVFTRVVIVDFLNAVTAGRDVLPVSQKDGVKVDIWLHPIRLFPEIGSRVADLEMRDLWQLMWTSFRSPPCRQAFNPADHHGGSRPPGHSFRNFGSEFWILWGNSTTHYPKCNGHAKVAVQAVKKLVKKT